MKYILVIFAIGFGVAVNAQNTMKPDSVVKEYYDSHSLLSETPYKDGKINGIAKVYYENQIQILKTELPYTNGELNGVVKEYYQAGTLQAETPYSRDMKNGTVKSYYENGNLMLEYPFSNNVRDGVFKNYDENGKLESEIIYENDKIVKKTNFQEPVVNVSDEKQKPVEKTTGKTITNNNSYSSNTYVTENGVKKAYSMDGVLLYTINQKGERTFTSKGRRIVKKQGKEAWKKIPPEVRKGIKKKANQEVWKELGNEAVSIAPTMYADVNMAKSPTMQNARTYVNAVNNVNDSVSPNTAKNIQNSLGQIQQMESEQLAQVAAANKGIKPETQAVTAGSSVLDPNGIECKKCGREVQAHMQNYPETKAINSWDGHSVEHSYRAQIETLRYTMEHCDKCLSEQDKSKMQTLMQQWQKQLNDLLSEQRK